MSRVGAYQLVHAVFFVEYSFVFLLVGWLVGWLVDLVAFVCFV